jgi:arylsulfatase A-like enzyme
MPKYNLLFIFTDEQRADTMAAYGNPMIETPNFNRLASESVVFERPYVTQPVCTPSRSSLLCGLYPHRTGCTENNVPLPPAMRCFPELLTDRDYATGYHGKWHLGDEIFAQHGFEDWVGIDDGYAKYYSPERDPEARSDYHDFLVAHGYEPGPGNKFHRDYVARLPEEVSKPAFLAQEASRFIRENKTNPFVLFVNFFEPHMPFYGPRNDQYDPDTLPLPASFNNLPTDDQPLKLRLFQRAYAARGNHGMSLKTEADWRRVIANYWGLCSLVDTYTGQILDTLDACGLRDNTIVVYTSDHGDMMGNHRLLAKCVMFEEAATVPLLLRLPGQREGRRISGPVSHIDLVPTLLDLMEQPIPAHLQGKSLKPILEQKRDIMLTDDVIFEWNGGNNGFGDKIGQVSIPESMLEIAAREEIIAAHTDPVRTIVTPEGWKFNCSPRGEHELYNLKDDPLEIHNLAFKPQWQPLMRELVERLRHWQTRTNDTVDLPTL